MFFVFVSESIYPYFFQYHIDLLLYALQILLPGLNDELEGRLLGLVGRLRVLVEVDGCPCGPADRLLVLAGVDGCPCVPVCRLNGCADSWAASRDFWQQPPSLWC